MYYKWIESDAKAKARYNDAAREACSERMKEVRKKAASIRSARKASGEDLRVIAHNPIRY